MAHDRGLAVHFSDGTSLVFSFAQQASNPHGTSMIVDEVLKRRVLTLEADGALYVVPFENVNYITVQPTGEDSVLRYTVKGASLVP